MELLPLSFVTGWSSGLNAYATVLVLGLIERIHPMAEIPDTLARLDVLIIAGVLFALEFFADKIPYVDSVWDSVSTVIRPIVGATIGALMAGASGDLWTIMLASVGGITALVSHLTKASIRLAVNTSPEPVSNIGTSVAEDTAAITATALAVTVVNPVVVAVVVALLLIASVALALYLMARVRRGWRAFRRWWARKRGTAETGSDV
ncbi:DUF4126 domain-containing protein [Enemella sp. A6]|uniref:DUF4126 domain-containing protein n=1 Tax=Enemella sp. A6 TaxID=3440152 RepID=UPI003EC0B399